MKKFLAFLMAAAITVTAVGCGDKDDSSEQETDEVSVSAETDDNEDKDDKDKDESSESQPEQLEEADKTGGIGDTLRTEFFNMAVVEAYRMTSVSGYIPNDPAYEYVCVHMLVESRFTETINVGSYDFEIVWGDTEAECDYAIEQDDFGFDKYPASVDIEYREKAEGNVFFMVPKDAKDLKLQYVAIFEDDSVGDIYQIELGDIGYLDDPYQESGVTYVGVGEKMSTTVFDMQVNSAVMSDELAGYTPDPGWKFLTVNVSMEGTSAEAIETGAYYFCVYWSEAEEDICYAIEDEEVVDFPIYTEIAQGDKVEGNMYFVVPDNAEYIDFYYYDMYDEDLDDYIVTLGSSESIAAA